jgi:anti-anti-sigma regulatory factor
MRSGSWEVTLVCVQHALETGTVAEVKERFNTLLERHGDVILDVRGAAVDSTGLGAVLSLQRQLELRDRRLLVVTQGASLLTLLDTAGATGALALYPDVEAAMRDTRAAMRMLAGV